MALIRPEVCTAWYGTDKVCTARYGIEQVSGQMPRTCIGVHSMVWHRTGQRATSMHVHRCAQHGISWHMAAKRQPHANAAQYGAVYQRSTSRT